jgi:hypothetical protein
VQLDDQHSRLVPGPGRRGGARRSCDHTSEAKTPWKLSVKKVPYFSSMYAANFRTSGLAGEKATFPRSSRFPSRFQPC